VGLLLRAPLARRMLDAAKLTEPGRA
jgi:hypothetical protein